MEETVFYVACLVINLVYVLCSARMRMPPQTHPSLNVSQSLWSKRSEARLRKIYLNCGGT